MKEEKVVEVVNAVCLDEQDRILLVLLRDRATGKCCWILPGGKMESNESMEDALGRELEEELALPKNSFSISSCFQQKFLGETPFSKKNIRVTLFPVIVKKGVEMVLRNEIVDFSWIMLDAKEVLCGSIRNHSISQVTLDIMKFLRQQ